ncbi:MAG: rod shape-determining protein MreC [Spirulinaceae cyanobacterium]
MFSSRRIWRKYGTRTLLTGLVISTAWVIRQTQGGLIAEFYSSAVRPFRNGPTQEEQLTSAKIQQLNQEVAELEVQNEKFKQLLGYVEKQDGESIVAPVVGRSADHWWHQVTLARGSKDGVKVGYVVVGIGGLVGRVTTVTPHTSRVLLISDPTSKIGVTVSRTRDMGAMKGSGTDRALMHFFEKVPDIRKGDVVTTSPVSRVLPAGIPIGTIESIDTESGPAPQATVKLSAPMGQLEWLVIHPFQPKS